eukprot:evm.model.NODE_37905_length_12283_cov_27.301800.1
MIGLLRKEIVTREAEEWFREIPWWTMQIIVVEASVGLDSSQALIGTSLCGE